MYTAGYAPLIIDIAGVELTADDYRRLQHPLVGGIIYFARNWQSRAQITELSHHIKSIRPDMLITVDHEGGRVQRFRTDGFTHIPPMRHLSLAVERMKDNSGMDYLQKAVSGAEACGYVLGSELRACGIDFTFAPVLDVDWPDVTSDTTSDAAGAAQAVSRSSVIGDRALAADPQLVAVLAQGVMQGLHRAGMRNCGKHFPGHGFARADSHVAIPVDKRPLEVLLQADVLPYRELIYAAEQGSGVQLAAVMPAHVIYPALDARPAGFSSRWIGEVLRGQLGFKGAVISDDLSMQAARQIQGRSLTMTEGVLAALRAGCDMALLCNQSVHEAVLDEVLEELEAALSQADWERDPASTARRLALRPDSAAMGWDELVRSDMYQAFYAEIDKWR